MSGKRPAPGPAFERVMPLRGDDAVEARPEPRPPTYRTVAQPPTARRRRARRPPPRTDRRRRETATTGMLRHRSLPSWGPVPNHAGGVLDAVPDQKGWAVES
ncbi:hypothetical protein ACH4NS_06990 [Streptomyces mutabilis]|uniref:hypothetical protein n=1 Tax=Streptomyces mutabilis TaxID=67332 RepID=UPI000BC78E23|nr:hypothetical protein [Streptomyces sp. DH17]PAM98897.1 hypothetical protein CJI59_26060 [Streptomyces sp. Alain-F2R5]